MTDALTAIKEIVEQPPSSRAELEYRMEGIGPAAVASALVTMLEDGDIDEQNHGTVIEVIRFADFEHEVERLQGMLKGRLMSETSRSVAMFILTNCKNEDGVPEFPKDLSPNDVMDTLDHTFQMMFTSLMEDPAAAREITELFRSMPDVDAQNMMFYHLNHWRVGADASASMVFAHALYQDDLAHLHDRMLEAVIAEGGAEAKELLVELRDTEQDANVRSALQKALLEVASNDIQVDSDAKGPEGFAYVSVCDGESAFVVIACFKRPTGKYTLVDLVMLATGDIRDGFVLPNCSQSRLEQLLGQIEVGGMEVTKTTLENAALVVSEIEELAKKRNIPWSTEIENGLKHMRRVPLPPEAIGDSGGDDNKLSGRLTSLRMEGVLDNPAYDTWFFDDGDLMEVGLAPPHPVFGPSKEWIDEALDALNTAPVLQRLTAMAQMAARWHHWRGEDQLSAVFNQCVKQLKRGFKKAVLPRIMIERTFDQAYGSEWEEDDHLSDEETDLLFVDPGIRQAIKGLMPDNGDAPQRKDLAVVDLAQFMHARIFPVFEMMPAEICPPYDQLPYLSLKAAEASWQLFQDTDYEGNPKKIISATAKSVARETRLTRQDAEQMIAMLIPLSAEFVAGICNHCPMGCYSLKNPTERSPEKIKELFFSSTHPAKHYDLHWEIDDDPEDYDEFDDMFLDDDEVWSPAVPPTPPIKCQAPKVGRNDLCPCGSGKKYIKCCGLH